MDKIKNNPNKRKIFSRILTVFTVAISLLAALLFFLGIKTRIDKSPVVLFGYSISIVVSPSMEPEINVGDLIVVKHVDVNFPKVGDNVVFKSLIKGLEGEQVVHKVVEKGEDEKGIYFVTKGVNNSEKDSELVRKENFVGVEIAHSSFWGAVIGFFTRGQTFLLFLIIVVSAYVLIINVIHILAE